jgi:hypothetical protein
VRLYRNTVDAMPADYTDVTAAVLNSAATDHGAGIKRYLDGAATVSGLVGGTTYHFWVKLTEARGNTVGPQPGGSYMTPTVWELYVTVSSVHPEPFMSSVSSLFGGVTVVLTRGDHMGESKCIFPRMTCTVFMNYSGQQRQLSAGVQCYVAPPETHTGSRNKKERGPGVHRGK